MFEVATRQFPWHAFGSVAGDAEAIAGAAQ